MVSDSLLLLARELVGPPPRSWKPPEEARWFGRNFPLARDPVLFFGPLGFQKRTLSLPERVLRIRQGVSGSIPEGEVVTVEYSTGAEAGVRRDSLLCALGGDVPPDRRGWQVRSWNGDALLVATDGGVLVVVRGLDRQALVELWRRLQTAKSIRWR
jgi:hypothetical protein